MFESVSPRCLWVSVSVSMVLFMSNGGGVDGLIYEKISLIMFSCIKSNQPCVCPSTDGIQVCVKVVGRSILGINNDV